MSGKSFLRSHWLLVVAAIASVIVLIFGIALIQLSRPGAATPPPGFIEEDFINDLPSLPELDNSPLSQTQLKATLDQLSQGNLPTDHGVSAEQLQEYLQQLESGSENWCDLMLLKADDAWTDEDAQIFAKHCI